MVGREDSRSSSVPPILHNLVLKRAIYGGVLDFRYNTVTLPQMIVCIFALVRNHFGSRRFVRGNNKRYPSKTLAGSGRTRCTHCIAPVAVGPFPALFRLLLSRPWREPLGSFPGTPARAWEELCPQWFASTCGPSYRCGGASGVEGFPSPPLLHHSDR
jgi:hypothetical protein